MAALSGGAVSYARGTPVLRWVGGIALTEERHFQGVDAIVNVRPGSTVLGLHFEYILARIMRGPDVRVFNCLAPRHRTTTTPILHI